MQQEATAHAAEDARKKEEAEVRNTADTLVYTSEKMLRDNKDKVSAELNSEVEGKIAALRSAIQANDLTNMKSATQALNESLQKIGQEVYRQQQQQPPPPGAEGQQQPPPPPPSGEGGKGEGTVEGEFREV